ncbi:MAG TPA: TetR/AcrR family transcriptional regulator [Alphaproteobacteria bacterium]
MDMQPALRHPKVAKSNLPDRQRRGRPLDPTKHTRILKAATGAFLEFGFQSTSMELVARRAGVSKITIYSHFRNKRALFGAIIDGLTRKLSTAIDRLAVGDMPLEQALRHVGRMYLELALASSSLALHRTVVADTARVPGLGRLIYEIGPAQVVGALAEYLARQRTLRFDDPHLAAEQFFGMVLGHAQLGVLFKARAPQAMRADIARRVDHAVRLFLHGVARSAGTT